MTVPGHSSCLPGTRVSTLEDINEWLINYNFDGIPQQNILWLYGGAGTGKSTVTKTIAQIWHSMARQGAYLSYDDNEGEPNATLCTLAHQLATFDGAICDEICKEIHPDETIHTIPLFPDLFNRILLVPLQRAAKTSRLGPIIIFLDALDQCGDEFSRRNLLLAITEGFPKLPPNFRFIIASRPEPDIKVFFALNDHIKAMEVTAMQNDIPDIRLYIQTELVILAKQKSLMSTWPTEDDVDKLASMSSGHFLWATEAIKVLFRSRNPEKTLRSILLGDNGHRTTLNDLYTISTRAPDNEDADFQNAALPNVGSRERTTGDRSCNQDTASAVHAWPEIAGMSFHSCPMFSRNISSYVLRLPHLVLDIGKPNSGSYFDKEKRT